MAADPASPYCQPTSCDESWICSLCVVTVCRREKQVGSLQARPLTLVVANDLAYISCDCKRGCLQRAGGAY